MGSNPVLLGLGIKQQGLGWHTKAVESFSSVLEDDPLNVEALFRRGISLFRLGLFDLCSEDFSIATEIAPSYKYIESAIRNLR